MKKTKFILFFVFFIFLASAIAQPPFQQSEGTGNAVIVYPKDIAFEYNSTFSFHIHMVNGSNIALYANEYQCIGHFYDTQNNHKLQLNSSDDSNGFDDFFTINQSITGEYQKVPYNIYCNSTQGEGAFVSGEFQITNDSEEKDLSAGALIAIIVLIPLIFGIFMIIGAATLGKDHDVLRIALFLMSPITIFVSFHFAMISLVKFYGLPELQESIGSTTYWMGWWFFVLVSYFIIYGIWKLFDYLAGKKEEKSRLQY